MQLRKCLSDVECCASAAYRSRKFSADAARGDTIGRHAHSIEVARLRIAQKGRFNLESILCLPPRTSLYCASVKFTNRSKVHV